MFVDELDIHVKAGRGGNGVVRWQMEKGKPRMGPAGGNGGNGANVYVRGVRDSSLLLKYRHNKIFKADDGEHGRKNSEYGAHGEDLVIDLPLGSIVTNSETGDSFEILEEDVNILILKGGRGGLGNKHFKSSVNISPKDSTDGKPGQECDFHIELKVIADVGLVGFPNAGKSSLLNVMTHANSKVGDYEFTTLDPSLGSLYGIIVADIPGIIEGASSGKGLGTKFLKHISRTGMILHCISAEREDVLESYKMIRKELKEYDPELLEKEEWIILTKKDMVSDADLKKKITILKKKSANIIPVSIIDDESIKILSDKLTQYFGRN